MVSALMPSCDPNPLTRRCRPPGRRPDERNTLRTQDEIRIELDRATARRRELWRELGHGRDAAGAAEVARLTTRIAELWEELRFAGTRERFGSPELIVKRAEVDRRLERELDRRIRLSPRRAA